MMSVGMSLLFFDQVVVLHRYILSAVQRATYWDITHLFGPKLECISFNTAGDDDIGAYVCTLSVVLDSYKFVLDDGSGWYELLMSFLKHRNLERSKRVQDQVPSISGRYSTD